ncbi:hypothetical protein P167DRAFT_541232 [Morchella conica CCBAS932]|uniref:WKF domain-containing protein n=1 Tax=Morchella conica CCBAS932 TaxID=1392247 RepID=A0A3N4L3M7_9PEZI|nr:hypothetical protein P167DRAFT_541232 [Morchella conica CCBAS932]
MSTTVAVHVPAWKKIGLKLKKAGDEPEVTAVKDAVPEVKAHDDGDDGEDKKERKRKKKERKEKEKREKAESASGDKPAAAGDQAEEGAKEKKKKKGKKSKSSTSIPESTTPSTTTPSTPTPAAPSTPTPTTTTTTTDPKSLLLRHPRAPPTSRKSVTFTSDTKATDGDSIKTLYQNHDPFAHYDSYQQHLANYPSSSSSAANELPAGFDDAVEPKKGAEIQYKFGSTGKRKKFTDDDEVDATASAGGSGSGGGGVKDATPATTTTKQKKESTGKASDKKDDAPTPKKRKPNPPKPSTAPTANTAPYLHYLTAHHLHRATWKFEKSKQNWILRHAFDSAQIPGTHDAALRGYIASVQGAAARDRLLEAANEVVKRGSDTISRDGEKVDV